MNKAIQLLGIALFAQVGLYAWSFQQDDTLATYNSESPFIQFGDEGLRSLKIVDSEGKELVISQAEKGDWVLPQADSFPAGKKKIEALKSKLQGIRRTFPVARTSVARSQLKVASDLFERKVTLELAGKQPTTMYLGSSPGFKQSHSRLEGENEIFALPLPLFEFSVNEDDWIDRELFSIPRESIEKIVFPELTLEREDGELMVKGMGADEALVFQERDALVAQMAKLRYLKRAVPADLESAKRVLRVTLTVSEEGQRDYVFYEKQVKKVGDEDTESKYFLQWEQGAYVVTLGEGIVKKMKAASRSLLVQKVVVPASVTQVPVVDEVLQAEGRAVAEQAVNDTANAVATESPAVEEGMGVGSTP